MNIDNQAIIDSLVEDFPEEGQEVLSVPNAEMRYIDSLQRSKAITIVEDKEQFWKDMEQEAMQLYRNVNNDAIAFKDRKAMADKILEIRGVLKSQNASSGNTFVFSEAAALRLAEGLGKMRSNMAFPQRDIKEIEDAELL